MPCSWTPLPELIQKNWSNVVGVAPRYAWMVEHADPQLRRLKTHEPEATAEDDESHQNTEMDEPTVVDLDSDEDEKLIEPIPAPKRRMISQQQAQAASAAGPSAATAAGAQAATTTAPPTGIITLSERAYPTGYIDARGRLNLVPYLPRQPTGLVQLLNPEVYLDRHDQIVPLPIAQEQALEELDKLNRWMYMDEHGQSVPE